MNWPGRFVSQITRLYNAVNITEAIHGLHAWRAREGPCIRVVEQCAVKCNGYTIVLSEDFNAVIVTFGTGRIDSTQSGGRSVQISTMNRIFGTSSSSKKPKPTLQDVIDQVRVASLEGHPPLVFTSAYTRRIPAQPLSKSR